MEKITSNLEMWIENNEELAVRLATISMIFGFILLLLGIILPPIQL